MSRPKFVLLVLSFFLIAGSLAQAQPAASSATAGGAYRVVQTLQVGGAGGFDYVTVDPQSKQIYIPRSNHTLVVNIASGKTVADITGQRKNHGVAIVAIAGRGFISDDTSVTFSI